MRELNPYDTGQALEPKSWLPYDTRVSPATPKDNFGKVDFDDENGDTEVVIQVLRDDKDEYTIHITPLSEKTPHINIIRDQQ